MLLEGKTGLILGVANKHSIAWAIAQSVAREGARLAFNYQGERLKDNVEELVKTLDGAKAYQCDVSSDEEIAAMMAGVQADFGKLDFLVHSVAYAPREELIGEFVNTSRAGFQTALDISAYSLVATSRAALPLMNEGGSIITLSYLGAERVVPHYNVMGVAKAALEASMRYIARDLGPRGIRVNAISAGPIKTLAAAGISSGRHMFSFNRKSSPLRDDTDPRGVAGAALYLLSGIGASCTGETLHVDAGFHIVGMPDEDALKEGHTNQR